MTETNNNIVLFGATSFVGRILSRRLATGDGAALAEGCNWVLAGRSRERLEEVKASLGEGGAALPLLVADASDPASLQAMCANARVVVSTVGPYALYGELLVKTCAESGTDYCDLSGELQWIRRMIARYQEAAVATGARLVHCCGFDSIPFDLGVWFLQQEARARFGQPLRRVKTRVKAAKGGFSGGTISSLLNLSKELAADPDLRRELGNPYSFCPPNHPFTARQHNVNFAQYDPDFDAWTAPFVMAPVNTRVVHRSNALSHASYGEDFRYDEAVMTGRRLPGRLLAVGMGAGLNGFILASVFAPSRALLRHLLPAPGDGPSEAEQANGFYDLRLFGETARGEKLRAKVTGDADPGYGSTARILGEAAACLAEDISRDAGGGFWTPSTLLGAPLLARLREHGGMTFEILD